MADEQLTAFHAMALALPDSHAGCGVAYPAADRLGYAQHVRHAYKFLRPGRTLVSILPATADDDRDKLKGEWRDLPVGSCSAAGTNVSIELLKMRKAA